MKKSSINLAILLDVPAKKLIVGLLIASLLLGGIRPAISQEPTTTVISRCKYSSMVYVFTMVMMDSIKRPVQRKRSLILFPQKRAMWAQE